MASICDSYCKGCIYKGIINGVTPWCKYVFMEDKLRPCPAGTGCTAKMTARDLKLLKAKEKKPLTEEQRRKQAEYSKAYRERKRIEKTKECKVCGKPFVPGKDFRLFCSEECAMKKHIEDTRRWSHEKWVRQKKKNAEARNGN